MLICNHFTPEAKERGLLPGVPPTRHADPAWRRASPPGAAPTAPPGPPRHGPLPQVSRALGEDGTAHTLHLTPKPGKQSEAERNAERGAGLKAASQEVPGRQGAARPAPPRGPPPYAAPSSPRSGLSGRLSTNGKSRPLASQGARSAWGSKLPPGSASPPRSASGGGTKRHVPARLTQ